MERGERTMVKNSAVPLFPNVPHSVDDDAVETPPMIFGEKGLRSLPPLPYAGSVRRASLLWQRYVLPSEDGIPNFLREGAC